MPYVVKIPRAKSLIIIIIIIQFIEKYWTRMQ